MRIGILGGTFDPIHIGHLIAAECAREQAGLDQVWFMPAYKPPHKTSSPIASAEHRLMMTREAISEHPHFKAEPYEIEQKGISYTIDTISALVENNVHVEFFFIIGGDMVQYLPKWHRITDLVKIIRFIGLKRPGFQSDVVLPSYLQGKLQYATMPQLDISSTDIRERRLSNRSVRYMVSDSVRQYMEVNHLYES